MLIALLAVLGVDLIVISVIAAGVLSRRRWISRQPAASEEQHPELLGCERPGNAPPTTARRIPHQPDARPLAGPDLAH